MALTLEQLQEKVSKKWRPLPTASLYVYCKWYREIKKNKQDYAYYETKRGSDIYLNLKTGEPTILQFRDRLVDDENPQNKHRLKDTAEIEDLLAKVNKLFEEAKNNDTRNIETRSE